MKLKKDQKAKAGKAAKDIVPASIGKPPRDSLPIRVPEQPDESIPFEITPSPLCPPWPGDEAASTHDFGLDSAELFVDPFEYCLPKSMITGGPITWSLPQEFVDDSEVISRFSSRISRMNPLKLDISIGTAEANAESEKMLAVVTSFERDETEEEYEQRKAEETEKWIQNKKKGKNPADDLPMKKVKEVSLGMMEMGKTLPSYSVWMSSQLSLLRDRDWKNQDGSYFWKRIYPQIDGVPVFNRSGKYWVKLLFLGQERLVEVDSRMPLDDTYGLLLPRSSTIRDLWPMLLSKAFLKLTTPMWRNINKYLTSTEQEIDGSFVYSLTGLLPQQCSLSQINKSEWSMFETLLNDSAWTQKTCLLSVHCPTDKVPYIPSMNEASTIEQNRPNSDFRVSISKPKDPVEEESKIIKKRFRTNAERFREAAGQVLEIATGKKIEFIRKILPCHVIPGFGYLLFDAFANPEDFDLQKVKREEIFRTEDEVKTALSKARVSSPARKLKKHRSPQRERELLKRKARREKEKDERRQKIFEKTIHPVEKLLKIKTTVTNTPVLNIHCNLTPNEVNNALLQILNRDYFQQLEMKDLEELLEKEDHALFDAESREEDFQIMLHRNDGGNPDLVHPLKRLNGGTWVSSEDFPFAFQQLIIYHNPLAFSHITELVDIWEDTTAAYVPNEKYDVWILSCPPETPTAVDMLVAFAPLLPNKLEFNPNSVSLTIQKYDFEQEAPEPWESETKISADSIKVARLTFEMTETLVLRPFLNCAPCGASCFVVSNVPVQTISKLEYLVSKGWAADQVVVEHMGMCKGLYYVLGKIEVKVTMSTILMMRLTASNPALLPSLRLFLVNRDLETDPLEASGHTLLDIQTLSTQRFTMKPNNNGYYLVLDGSPLFNTGEGQVSIDFLQKQPGALTFEQIDLMDPVEFSDGYSPNKYGAILKEHLFVGSDTPLSIHVRLRRGGVPAAAQAKGKEIVLTEESALDTPRMILLELYEGEQLRLKTKGRNQAHFPHIRLQAGQTYLLTCSYDLREWPEAGLPGAETDGINWAVRVFACDTVVLVKDTRKEDREDAIRKGWETAQPGRNELAKASRLRFIAQQKSGKGEPLSDAETAALKDTWEDRRKAKKDLEANPKAKGKAGAKEDKKAKEKEQAQEAVVQGPLVIPDPSSHMMVEIKSFLEHIHGPRLLIQNTEFVGKTHLSPEQLEEIKTNNQSEVEKWASYMTEQKAKIQEHQASQLQQMQESKDRLEAETTITEEALNSYKGHRDAYKTTLEESREATIKLKTVLQNPDVQSLNEALEQAKKCRCAAELLKNAKERLIQMVLEEVNGNLKTGIEGNDVEPLKLALTDIEKYGVEDELDARIVARARRLVTSLEG